MYSPHQQQMQYLVEFTLAEDSEEKEEREGEEKEGEEGDTEEVTVVSGGEEETTTGGEGEECEQGFRVWGVIQSMLVAVSSSNQKEL